MACCGAFFSCDVFGHQIEHAPFDAAADGLALDFLHVSMPPVLTEQELQMRCAVVGIRRREEEVL